MSLCERLKQEVHDKEVELKQERERLLVLSRTESDLSARLQGETEKTKSLDSNVSELKEQLTKCQEIETSKAHLEAQLHVEEERFHSSLKAAQEEILQEREKYQALTTVEASLTTAREELEEERRKGCQLEAVLLEKTTE